MDNYPAEQGPDQLPFEITMELAERVRTVGADNSVPVESLPYLLAHPDAGLEEVVEAARHDYGQTVRWLGRAMVVVDAKFDTILARFIYRQTEGSVGVQALFRLLHELHGNEYVPQPPPRIEPSLRADRQEPPVPAVISGVFDERPLGHRPIANATGLCVYGDYEAGNGHNTDERKAAMVKDYLVIVNTARAAVPRSSVSSERQYHSHRAKAGLEAFLSAIDQGGEAGKDYFASRVRAFAAEVLGVSYSKIDRVIPGFAAAATFLGDILENYIDTTAATTRSIRSVRAMPLHIDRLVLNMLKVESKFVAEQMGVGQSIVNMSNTDCKAALRRLFDDNLNLAWVKWDDAYIPADKMPGKGRYLQGLREYHASLEFDAVLGTPLTAEEVMYYAGRADDLYLKRLADYSELATERSVSHFRALMDHGEMFAAPLLDIDQLDYPVRSDADRIVWHSQACLEVGITAVAAYLRANPYPVRSEWMWQSLGAFWRSLHTSPESELPDDEGVEAILASYMPDTGGMVYNRANYHLRQAGRMLIRERYPLVGNTGGTTTVTPKELFLPPETGL